MTIEPVRLDAEELAEMLGFIAGWLASDRDDLNLRCAATWAATATASTNYTTTSNASSSSSAAATAPPSRATRNRDPQPAQKIFKESVSNRLTGSACPFRGRRF